MLTEKENAMLQWIIALRIIISVDIIIVAVAYLIGTIRLIPPR